MKHIKKFEKYTDYVDDPYDDAYLETYIYFVETWINGNNSQLCDMLKKIKKEGQLSELIGFVRETLDESKVTELLAWITNQY